MDQFRQIGKVLGSLKALMVFKDDIQINQKQCCLLLDIFELAFEGIAEEMKDNLKFQERNTKWKILEQPLKELHGIFKEGEFYVKQCLETNKDFWAKVISLAKNTDCVEFHIHNLLCCIPVVVEAIESVGEISGCDEDDDIQKKKKIVFSSKYEKKWRDPKIFQWKFGKQYLVSQDIVKRLEMAWKEDRWVLVQMIMEKRKSTMVSKQQQQQQQRLAEMFSSSLSESNVKLFPSSILFGSKDFQVRRRLGSGSQYKEIQWLGESFVLRYISGGDIEPLIPQISRLSSLAHPNIAHALCAFTDEEKKECSMVMELMNKDLYNHIKETCGPRKRIPFTLPVAVDLMLQIARGMEYLHSQKIYHGDLNPSNVLVRERSSSTEGYLHAKVSGFNLFPVKNTTGKSASTQNGTITFIWYAPEVLLEQEQPGNICNAKYTEKADIYSFGMICFELLTGKVPFEDSHLQGDKMSRNIRAGERPLVPFHSPKYLTSLTKKCWQNDPFQRPTFSSICRILRYIKRFLLMNPDHSQPDPPLPQIDYYEVEVGFLKKLVTVGNSEPTLISQIPFQMFSYKVLEKEKASANLREKGSESSSDGASSACGDENLGIVDDPFPAFLEKKNPVQLLESVPNRRNSLLAKKNIDAKTNKPVTPRGRALRPPQLTSCGRSIRMNSESQLPMVSPSSRRRASGHASDSELG